MAKRLRTQKLKANDVELVAGGSANGVLASLNMQESVNTLNVKNKRRNYASCTCCNDYRFANFSKRNNKYIIWR
jgi:hypothetical protein